jgi:hypothetical protein
MEVSLDTTPEQALEFAKRLARDDEFRERLATNAEDCLGEYGITVSSEKPFGLRLPPKHAVESALVNLEAASPFHRDDLKSPDPTPMAFWPFMIFIAT